MRTRTASLTPASAVAPPASVTVKPKLIPGLSGVSSDSVNPGSAASRPVRPARQVVPPGAGDDRAAEIPIRALPRSQWFISLFLPFGRKTPDGGAGGVRLRTHRIPTNLIIRGFGRKEDNIKKVMPHDVRENAKTYVDADNPRRYSAQMSAITLYNLLTRQANMPEDDVRMVVEGLVWRDQVASREDFAAIKADMATKEDIADMATKADIAVVRKDMERKADVG